MPWLLNEAAAIKSKVSGLTVTDSESPSGRPVEVWFRDPENELRDMTFPSIVLEYSGINKASDREHRGITYLPYIPEGFGTSPVPTVDPVTGADVLWDPGEDDVNLSPFRVADYPIPYNIDFTVTVYSRFQTELMPLMGTLAQNDRLPSRFGYVEVPEDGTVRTLDLIGGPEIVAERDSEGKRLFRAVYSVRVVSELNLFDVMQITSRINTVALDLHTITAT